MLAADDLLNAYTQMGRALREIHRVPMDSFGYIGPNGVWTAHPSNRAYMSFQFDRKLAEFSERSGEEALCDRLRGFVAERMQLLEACATASLCHFDFHAGNIWPREKTGHCACRDPSTSKVRLPAIR